MGLNDQYYRGLVEYTNNTNNDKDIAKLNNVIKQTDVENDVLETVKLVCNIDEDWVKNIEEGLVYVEKAVREERQFIRTEGDVVPIERAKHTSKTTVEHLARHSNFITHLPEKEGDDLVPDKLYIVEKESDYAVYENRFLYMMLTYLRDFIAIRLNRIRDMMTTYRGKFAVNKKVDLARRQINVEIKLSDQIKDDPILLEKYSAIKIIDRIEMQYHLVLALLATPLMEQVSKAPMIKPPITKTNTLKMNTNFKTSLALYDYISAYSTDGYSFTEEVVKLNPFNDETADDYAKLISLNAFLTYKNANGLSKELKNGYIEYEKELKEQEKIQRVEQLKRLKRHINESSQTMEEYLITLEAQNRVLEKEQSTLVTARKTIDELNGVVKRLEQENAKLVSESEELNQTIIQKDEEIQTLNENKARELYVQELEHKKKVEAIKIAHAKEIENLNRKHENNIRVINANHAKNIEEIKHQHAQAIEELNKQHELETQEAINQATRGLQDEKAKILEKNKREVDSLNNDINRYRDVSRDKDAKINKALDDKKRMINDYEDKIYNLIKQHREDEAALNEEIKSLQDEIKSQDERIEHLIQERQFVDAQLHIIRVEQGKTTDEYDYTSKERFEELEAQYKAFKQLFVKEWGKTKKRIREEMFAKSNEELKALDEQDKAKEQTDVPEKQKDKPKAKKKKVKAKDALENPIEEKENDYSNMDDYNDASGDEELNEDGGLESSDASLDASEEVNNDFESNEDTSLLKENSDELQSEDINDEALNSEEQNVDDVVSKEDNNQEMINDDLEQSGEETNQEENSEESLKEE